MAIETNLLVLWSISYPLLISVTPVNYEPPGFQEGVCDNLWFEGTAVHFRVGEVQTAFHSLNLRVAAEQSRVEKLHEGNHIRDSRPSTGEPPGPHLPQPLGGQVTSICHPITLAQKLP